jgi:hypothetical protein
MVDWQERITGAPEPDDGMSPEEILSAFDRLIVQQERR